MCKSILSLTLLLLLTSFSFAEDGDFHNVEQIGFFDYWDSADQTIIVGNLAHVSTGISGYRILDISDAVNPVELDHCLIDGRIHYMKVVGDYAYLLVSDETLTDIFVIINISDPSSIFEVGRIENFPQTYRVDASGNLAFISHYCDGMLVIDISDPANPVEIYHYEPNSEIYGVVCHNDLVYISKTGSGVVALDFTDPLNPAEVASCFPGHIWDIYPSNGYLLAYKYVNSSSRIIVAIDITNPQEMSITSEYPLLEGEDLLNVDRRLAFIRSDQQTDFRVIDFSNINSPTETISFQSTSSIKHVNKWNEYYFLSQGEFVTIDISNPSLPVEVARTGVQGTIENIEFVGNYGFSIFDQTGNFIVYDFADPTEPLLLEMILFPDSIMDFAISNGYCYLLVLDGMQTYNYIRIVNISDPTNVYSEGILNLAHRYTNIESFGDYVFLSSLQNNVRIMDVSNPLEPVLRGEIPISGIPQGYDLVEHLLYCVDDDGHLTISSIFNPDEPRVITSYEFSAPENPFDWGNPGFDVEVVDGLAYITYARIENGFALPNIDIYDISDPDNIGLINSILLNYICYSMEIANGYLFLANSFDGFRIFDIHNPLDIVETGYFNTYGESYDIEFFGDNVVIADRFYMEIFDYNEATNGVEDKYNTALPEEFAISSAYPNPFNPTVNIEVSLPISSQLDLSIYNIVGQEVANLNRSSMLAGKHTFIFNGSQLSSGIYFVHASIPGYMTQTRKIILMK